MTNSSFVSSYTAALAAYVGDRNERRLKAAYDLGRAAVEQGLGVLDVAAAHNDAVLRAAEANDALAVIDASADFLIESLASFEMVQRGLTDARRAAWEERRRARMLRELSAVLADAAVASAARESAHELAQLMAETVRELTGAAEASVVFESASFDRSIAATAVEPEADTWSEIVQPTRHPEARGSADDDVLTEPILSIDGRSFGHIEVSGVPKPALRRDGRPTVRQVADLAAAWLERTHHAPSF